MGLLSVLIENYRLNDRLGIGKTKVKMNTNIPNKQESVFLCVFGEINIASKSFRPKHLGFFNFYFKNSEF